jgi:O-antigen ligase
MPDYHIDRLQKGIGTGTGERRDFAAESRLLLWKAGLQMFRDSPVVGVGPDNYQILSPEYAGFYAGRTAEKYIPGVRRAGMVTHNTWIQTLAEGGVVTAIPFVSMFVLGFLFLVRARRRIPRTWPEWKDVYTLSVILEGMFLGFCVCAFFGSYIKIDFLWWYLGTIGALSLAVEDRLAHFHEARKRAVIASRLRHGPPQSFPGPSPSGA